MKESRFPSPNGKQPLKILQVSDVYFPYPGGISVHVHELSRRLRARGHEVWILTGEHRVTGVPFEDPPYVIRVGKGVIVPANKSLSSVPISPRISRRVKQILEEGRYDIVHIHGSLAPVLPVVTLRHSKSVNFFTFHAAHEESLGYELFRPYLLRLFRKIHGRIAVSEVARETVRRYFPAEYRIIPNGVDVERFHPSVSPIPTLRTPPFKNILFVGRFDPRKGLRFLLMAFPKILEKVPEARLIIVGGGPLKMFYKSFIRDSFKDRVIFAGVVPAEELPRYYRTADVFVSPATGGESQGIVLLEAMASGVPVVASDIPGYRQVIEDGVDGILVPPEDPEAIAQAVVALLRDPGRARRLAQRGRRKAETRYSWEKVVDQVEAYYFEVLDRVLSASYK